MLPGAVLPEHPAPASPSPPRPVFSSDHQSEASGPAALFWAATAYNITDGMMTAAPQLMWSINGFNKVATNTDRSIDLYFGAAEAGECGGFKLDPDRRRPRLPRRPSPLWHWRRVLRSELEAGRRGEGEVAAFPTALLRYATAASARFPTVHQLQPEGRPLGPGCENVGWVKILMD